MNPIDNPYAPGAGTQPPELAGRDRVLEQVSIALQRIRAGRVSKSVILVGLRGVGKTVVLDRMRSEAEAAGFVSARVEAPEGRSLPGVLAPQLRLMLLRLSRQEQAKALADRGLRALAGLAKSLKLKYADIELGIDLEPELGLADNGDLETDLTTVLEQIGLAARRAQTAAVLFLDELQYLEESQLGALIAAIHRCTQQSLPIALVGAGLPQVLALAGNAKSYAERLFDFPFIGALPDEQARLALEKPAQTEGVQFEDAALSEIIELTRGYPYFLQEWGKHAWDVAGASPITRVDVQSASVLALAEMDEGFFRMRFDRCTPKEKLYLRAMAELGTGLIVRAISPP